MEVSTELIVNEKVTASEVRSTRSPVVKRRRGDEEDPLPAHYCYSSMEKKFHSADYVLARCTALLKLLMMRYEEV